MTPIKAACTAILLFATCQIFAQSNFEPAIVINNHGDSIRGQVDYRNWKKNPESITFLTASNERQKLDPASIQGFSIPSESEVYKSYDISVDMRTGDQNYAIQNAFTDSPLQNKKAFLLQLVGSEELRLYRYTDINKDHFYYVKNNETPVELVHHYVYDESTKQVKENVSYKHQMNQLFSDCAAAMQGLGALTYSEKEIKNSFLRYIQCKFPTATATAFNVKSGAKTSFGILAGVSSTRYDFSGSDDDLVDENYSSSTTPIFGVSMDISLPRKRDQWHFVNELVYKSYKTDNTFTKPYNNFYTRTTTVNVHFSYIQLNTLFRYMYPSKGSLRPFINLGIANAIMIAEGENSIHNSYSFGKEEDIEAFDSPKKYEFSLLGGFGLKFRQFELEFRYAGSGKSFSPYHNLNVNPRSMQGLLVYRF